MTGRLVPFLYDRLLEPLVGGFREAGLRLAPARAGLRVLDVGCGTGTHLLRYAEGGAWVVGIDRSEAMVGAAAGRLAGLGSVLVSEAEHLPFTDGAFDLVIGMTVLHEHPRHVAARLLAEMVRVCRGSVLVVDHHPGRASGVRGRAIRALGTAIERVAGRKHAGNRRRLLGSGGVPSLAAAAGFEIAAVSVEASGTMGVYLVRDTGS
jgi:SAM-dependent methyltransferase